MKINIAPSVFLRVMGSVLVLLFSSEVYAQTIKRLPLQDLSAFQDPGNSWKIAGEVMAPLDRSNILNTAEGTGILVNNPQTHNGKDLFTSFTHGDIDLELDYMMAKGSNSGIYLQGRYEIQLRDSWTVKNPTSGDNGGIYERWDESRPEGKKGYQGYPPRQNASRAPGVWQHLEISFQAPRFDSEGNKVENAKILHITLNGVTIHKNVELYGPTRGAIGTGEVARGPLRLQGDHGAVAFRNIKITRFDKPAPDIRDLKFEIFKGAYNERPDLDTLTAMRSGASELLTAHLGNLPDQFLLRYTGTLRIKEAGNYTFGLEVDGGGGLLQINGEEVVPMKHREGKITLTEGTIPFELLYARRGSWAAPHLALTVSAEGLRTQLLSDSRLYAQNGSGPIYVRADERPLLRSFMDLPGGTRITHAVSVSSLDKVHYTYDLKHGNLVQLWRGRFLNATPMWYSRGDGSARPHGSVQYLLEEPAYALNRLENKHAPWIRDSEAANFRSHGYVLDINNNPTFKYEIFGTAVKDKIRVISEGKGIERTLSFQNAPDDLYVRLASGSSIKKVEENRFLIDDQSYYLEVNSPADSADPFIRSVGDHQELIIPAQSTVNYSILF